MWIEISINMLKLHNWSVTPLAGVWIEIVEYVFAFCEISVTPLAGVWIEIRIILGSRSLSKSLPSRECGLK